MSVLTAFYREEGTDAQGRTLQDYLDFRDDQRESPSFHLGTSP